MKQFKKQNTFRRLSLIACLVSTIACLTACGKVDDEESNSYLEPFQLTHNTETEITETTSDYAFNCQRKGKIRPTFSLTFLRNLIKLLNIIRIF